MFAVLAGRGFAAFESRRRSPRFRLMHWPHTHFLADHFPDLEHPAYQSGLEKLTFVAVTAMLIGSLITATVLVMYEL